MDDGTDLTGDGRVRGAIMVADMVADTVADTVAEHAAEALAGLCRLGLRPVLLTGDREAVAREVAAELGIDEVIDEVIAEVLPEQKQQQIERLQSEGRPVALIGDGVDDAAARPRPISGSRWAPAPTPRSRPAA